MNTFENDSSNPAQNDDPALFDISNAEEELPEEASQNLIDEPSLSVKEAKKANRKASKNADKKAAKNAGKKAAEDAGRKAAEDAGRKATKDAGRKAAKKADRKATKDAGRKAAKKADRKAAMTAAWNSLRSKQLARLTAASIAKGDIPWYRKIQFKLIVSFLIPVLFIIILGVASYSKASQGVVRSYESSASQTLDMMNQFLTLTVDTIQSNNKSYIADDQLSKYFKGMYINDSLTMANILKKYTTEFKTYTTTDASVSGVYFLSDDVTSITTTIPTSESLYSAYLATPQGTSSKQDIYNYYLFGNVSDADAALGVTSDSYGLRLVRHMNGYKSFMIIDLKKSVVTNALSTLDTGEGGYAALITTDGTELLADGTNPAKPLFTETSYYQDASSSGEDSGQDYVKHDGKDYLFLYSELKGRNAMICAMIPKSILTAQANDIKTLTIILVLIATVIAGCIGAFLARGMGQAITGTVKQLKRVAKGDLTVTVTTTRSDEFMLLANSVNSMIDHMKQLITKVTEMGGELSEASASVTSTAGMLLDSSRQIQSSIHEIETGTSSLDEDSAGCLSQMDALSARINDVSSTADALSSLTSLTEASVITGVSSLSNVTDSTTATTEITGNVIAAIEQLEKKSRSIGDIIRVINEIAEQTNLLSLNASIEAARAGAAGRGFSVVAEEIRKLAEQSHDSAAQINQIVDEITGNTRDVVSIAGKAEGIVKKQEENVSGTSESFNLIRNHVTELMNSLGSISNNVQNMEDARLQTLHAMEGISAVSAETAAGTSSVIATTDSQLEEIASLESAASNLTQKAVELNELLTQFTV